MAGSALPRAARFRHGRKPELMAESALLRRSILHSRGTRPLEELLTELLPSGD